jgi:hypothetical protein
VAPLTDGGQFYYNLQVWTLPNVAARRRQWRRFPATSAPSKPILKRQSVIRSIAAKKQAKRRLWIAFWIAFLAAAVAAFYAISRR